MAATEISYLFCLLPPCREFQTPDEEMKKIVLKVVKQCVGTEGVEPEYIRTEVGSHLGLSLR